MEVRYFPTDDFVAFIKEKGLGTKATLRNFDGHNRWVITEEDGTEYIARPESGRDQDE